MKKKVYELKTKIYQVSINERDDLGARQLIEDLESFFAANQEIPSKSAALRLLLRIGLANSKNRGDYAEMWGEAVRKSQRQERKDTRKIK